MKTAQSLLIVIAFAIGFTRTAVGQETLRTIAGREDLEISDGPPDGWDLTVILTTPIEIPPGFSIGVVENISYYADDGRIPEEHPIAPVLVKYVVADDEYIVEGVGKLIIGEENGLQEAIPFELERGSNIINAGEPGVTWHAAVFQGHLGGDTGGSLIPYGDFDGAGVFGYDSGPDEELEPGQVLTNGHASPEGGRNYSFNLGLLWSKGDDSDGDGIFDVLEEGCDLDPAVADSDSDKDEDGLTALQELNETGTGCLDPDSDDDGLKDGVETKTGTFVNVNNTGTDPLNADTDDDSLADGVENGSGVFVSAENPGTNPNKEDSDNDGFSDKAEIALGTNPNDAGSKPQEAPSLPEFGTEDWADLGDGTPDGWDLTVIFTTPIEFPDGEGSGTVTYFNYFHSAGRNAGDHTVAPVLVKFIEETDEWVVAGVGEAHVADEAGPQEKIPFVPIVGSNVLEAEDGVTWHPAVYQGHPGFGNDSNGSVVPFGNGGAGMFGYNNGPDEELEEGLVLTNGHESPEGGRHYAFNFGINFGPLPGAKPFQIIEFVRTATETTLTWNSRDGGEYAVDYREILNDGVWIELDDGVTSEGETTTFVDDDAARNALESGWYRIREI